MFIATGKAKKMKLSLIAAATVMTLLAGTVAAVGQSSPNVLSMRVVGYYPSWAIYQRQFFVNEIPAGQLTHLNYAFANISEDGEVVLGDAWADTQFPYPGDVEGADMLGNFNQLRLLKEAHAGLQTLISVGGWTWSSRFSDVALTEESRQRFARSAVDFMTRYGFDGVDIDWEYPTGGGNYGNVNRPEDPENFVLLLAEIRAQLDVQGELDGRHYLLTIAAGAGESAYAPLGWERIHPSLDFINVMTYDFAGSFSDATGHASPLFDSANTLVGSVDRTVQGMLAAGVPADKLVVGVPFYGHSWARVEAENDGMNQPFTGSGPGTWEPGWLDYSDITANHLDMPRFWDDEAQVPWLYDAETGIMISYEDPESARLKAQYVVENGLGGIMFWEVTQDTADLALLNAITAVLNTR